MTRTIPKRGDVVKLGRTAQELHTVVAVEGVVFPVVLLKQHTTGRLHRAKVERCVIVTTHRSDEREESDD